MSQFIFGPKAIYEALKNKYVTFKAIYYTNESQIKEIRINTNKIQVNEKFFKKFNHELNHQYLCAEIESQNFFNSIEEFLAQHKLSAGSNNRNLLVILDQINDPRNFGSIIRTCYGLGATGIIYKKDNQVQINELVQKTALGAANFIPLIKVTNLTRTIQILQQHHYWIYVSTLSDRSQNALSIRYDPNSALIIGNEQNGVSQNLLKNADFHIKIPMYNNFDSLNVAVATGILVATILNKK